MSDRGENEVDIVVDDAETEKQHPIDKGWAWMIVVGKLFLYLY